MHESEVQQSKPLEAIFKRKSKQQTLRRILLRAGTAFFQQVGGTSVIAYYLPVVLTGSVGLDNRMALILSAVDSLSLMFWACVAVMLIGSQMRNVGTSFATTTNWLFVYVIVVATPTVIASIQWKYYMLFAIFNFCFLPIIWYFYVETSNLSLEQIDRLFEIKHEAGNAISWTEATTIARTEVISDLAHTGKEHLDPAVRLRLDFGIWGPFTCIDCDGYGRPS
ncbi:hypothetical protein N7449_010659 [Penicillium cf. viridicatum]|uniref:Major facilitator superfamily (MFS) profile domain-containing protein n=1 Tax=Penicillium cf. viridicatum TaxID=2972119 RepID=A0A9W9J3M0_9EURO|nr:hypothetical protein N7449_010659 [Penicillium cf. viridicatum]